VAVEAAGMRPGLRKKQRARGKRVKVRIPLSSPGGKVGDASPAYSGLGRWWYCLVYLLHVTCVCTMHVTAHWRWESLFQRTYVEGIFKKEYRLFVRSTKIIIKFVDMYLINEANY
jgi:hypothetical protein